MRVKTGTGVSRGVRIACRGLRISVCREANMHGWLAQLFSIISFFTNKHPIAAQSSSGPKADAAHHMVLRSREPEIHGLNLMGLEVLEAIPESMTGLRVAGRGVSVVLAAIALIGGGLWGAVVARKRGGNWSDMLQYATGYGISFGLLAILTGIALARFLDV